MKIGLITFAAGDPIWRLAAFRLKDQAKQMQKFAKISIYSKRKLKRLLTPADSKFIGENAKGAGYWIWKPIIIVDFLEKNPEIEIVLYLDAGCEINNREESCEAFDSYIEFLQENDALVFSMDHLDINWTKNSLIQHLKPSDDDLMSGQLLGGVHFMKRDFAIGICKEWLRVMRIDNYMYLRSNLGLEHLGFNAHRHDQSIFSLLIKRNNNIKILKSESNLYFHPEWHHGLNKPIWTSRRKSLIPSIKSNMGTKIVIFLERIVSKLYRDFIAKK